VTLILGSLACECDDVAFLQSINDSEPITGNFNENSLSLQFVERSKVSSNGFSKHNCSSFYKLVAGLSLASREVRRVLTVPVEQRALNW
jgi:hypothetical protein